MKSMTGYGRGECAQDGFKITVEVSSVNRRQSEVVVYTPRELELLESQLRDEINRQVSRGRLTVRVTLHAAEKGAGTKIRLNLPLAKAYGRELERLARELKLTGPVTLEHILRAPGVVQTEEEVTEAEDFWPAMHKALREALPPVIQQTR
ncbi:MAG TPA: YicC family protein, partial [Candidatus Paceibacterota bacterium]|nr:YicC family protein [Candidatus Paceibacterota bacterium]